VFFLYYFFPQKYKASNNDNHDDTDKEDTSTESRSEDDEELGEISDVRNCAICLESFNPNDNVCTSNNNECQHGKSFC